VLPSGGWALPPALDNVVAIAGGGAGAWLERALLFALESDWMVVLTLSHVARVDGW
jgi:hypothetical protein